MLKTSTRTFHRLGRLASGLAVVAAAATASVLAATPAYADPVVRVGMLAQDELRIEGSEQRDGLVVSGAGPFYVSDSSGFLKAGPGCVKDGARVRCDQVKLIQVFAKGGDDSVRNNTPLPSNLFGGGGNDQLTGGFDKDFIEGNVGGDVVDGRSGFDTCSGETESNCEK